MCSICNGLVIAVLVGLDGLVVTSGHAGCLIGREFMAKLF